MADYRITKISQEEPREWKNPQGGTIYYHKVMLEGWDKPVSIGKQKPHSLAVGQTVSGTILIEAGRPEDKFKADPKPFGGGGGGSSKPAYQPKDEHAIAKAVALKAAVDYVAARPSEVYDDVLGTADKYLAWLEADKPKLNASPDPMDKVHAQNPLNGEFGQVEYIEGDKGDIPF